MFQNHRNSLNLPVALPLDATGAAYIACSDPKLHQVDILRIFDNNLFSSIFIVLNSRVNYLACLM